MIGIETYVARRSMLDGENKANTQPFHLMLLAPGLDRITRASAASPRTPTSTATATSRASTASITLGITPVDPILSSLPFERFLNSDPATTPDIDVDFQDGPCEEVIAYVGRKYGQDRVAQIITSERCKTEG